jgi:predicted nucleic acid-binding protein
VIVVDTSAIVAYMNANDDHHSTVSAWLAEVDDDLVTTPLIVAEVDHLVATRGGAAALSALWDDLVAGAYLVEWWPAAITASARIAKKYADNGLSLADASLVALAERAATTDIATLDERHFRALRPLAAGASFRLLPTDA